MRKEAKLTVLNQSHSPAFQEMIEHFANELGPIRFLSGRQIETSSNILIVERLNAYDRGPLRRRALSWLHFMVTALWRLSFTQDKSLILGVSNPPLTANLLWALSYVRSRPYGLLVWDIYPDALSRHGMMAEGNILSKLWRRANAAALRRADFVVTIGDRMKKVLQAQMDESSLATRIEVIPNWVDTELIKPIDKKINQFLHDHNLVDKTIVLYSGNIGAGHGVEILPAAAESFRSRQDLVFLVIGSGLGSEALQAEAARRGLDNFKLLPYQPAEIFPFSSAAADIALVFQRPGTEDISMPSKTYTALAAGSAVLAVTKPDSDLARLVEDKDVGIVVDYTPDAIAEGLQRLLGDPERLQKMRENARHVAVTEYDTDVVKEQWLRLLRDSIGHGDGAKR